MQKSESTEIIELNGEAYKGKFELNNWKSIENYLKSIKQLEMCNKYTKEQIKLSGKGIDKLLHRAACNGEVYKKSLAHLPEIIKNMVYISSEANRNETKKGFNEYKRYLTEIKMNGKDYTVLSIVGKNQEGFYYDQQLFPYSKNEFLKERENRFADVGQLGWAKNRPAGTESEPIYKYSKFLADEQGESEKKS
jgi:hypothetical protein